MRPVARVAVWSSDPLTTTGIASWLRGSPVLRLVSVVADPEVVVAAEDVASAEMVERLRVITGARDTRVVLVINRVADGVLSMAASAGVVRLLSRESVKSDALIAAVSAAGSTSGCSCAKPCRRGCLEETLSALRRQGAQLELLGESGRAEPVLGGRELDLLRLIAAGWDTAEIALELSYSERTVKNMVHRLLSRLALRNRTHAVAYAVRAGVI